MFGDTTVRNTLEEKSIQTTLMLQKNLQEKPARVIPIKIYLKKEFMLKAVPIK